MTWVPVTNCRVNEAQLGGESTGTSGGRPEVDVDAQAAAFTFERHLIAVFLGQHLCEMPFAKVDPVLLPGHPALIHAAVWECRGRFIGEFQQLVCQTMCLQFTGAQEQLGTTVLVRPDPEPYSAFIWHIGGAADGTERLAQAQPFAYARHQLRGIAHSGL